MLQIVNIVSSPVSTKNTKERPAFSIGGRAFAVVATEKHSLMDQITSGVKFLTQTGLLNAARDILWNFGVVKRPISSLFVLSDPAN